MNIDVCRKEGEKNINQTEGGQTSLQNGIKWSIYL